MWEILSRCHWWRLRWGLRRFVTVRGYIPDFVMPRARLVIEVDGWAYHSSALQVANDNRRTLHLEAEGWTVIRLSHAVVTSRPAEAVAAIRRTLRRRSLWLLSHPKPRHRRWLA